MRKASEWLTWSWEGNVPNGKKPDTLRPVCLGLGTGGALGFGSGFDVNLGLGNFQRRFHDLGLSSLRPWFSFKGVR